jgi:hypothetical protein
VDVRDWEDVMAAAEQVSSRSGAVAVAVNVPGINRRKPVLELEASEFSEVLDVNIRGLFHCAKAFGGIMVPNGHGSIINMASIFGLVAMERQAAYASSKGAVVQPRPRGPLRGGVGDHRPHGLSRLQSLQLRHRDGADGGRRMDGGLRREGGIRF